MEDQSKDNKRKTKIWEDMDFQMYKSIKMAK